MGEVRSAMRGNGALWMVDLNLESMLSSPNNNKEKFYNFFIKTEYSRMR